MSGLAIRKRATRKSVIKQCEVFFDSEGIELVADYRVPASIKRGHITWLIRAL